MASFAAQLFGSLVAARNRGYERGWLGVARLPAPVISIGNISTGGSGKTPAVIAVGEHLAARGIAFDVLTRGYGRRSRKLEVAETGEEAAAHVGDEPLLISRRLHCPVLVHADRFRAGLEGERRFGSRLHLLDDGFQHRQLARSFDLVLVRPGDVEDRLLPSGRLRELPAALRRAGAVLWLGGEAAEGRGRLAAFTDAPVFAAHKRPRATLPPEETWFAFCGLARPESFWATLQGLGIKPVGRHAFRDHFRYQPRHLRELWRRARAAGATRLITTAKDAVKLPVLRDVPAPQVVEIELEVEGQPELVEMMLRACAL